MYTVIQSENLKGREGPRWENGTEMSLYGIGCENVHWDKIPITGSCEVGN
jgi:hypothetical protein